MSRSFDGSKRKRGRVFVSDSSFASSFFLPAAFVVIMVVSSSLLRRGLAFSPPIGRARKESLRDLSKSSMFASAQAAGGLILPGHPDTPIRSVMAPMVAASDYPFRLLCRMHGVDLTFTQMLHSKNFVRDPKFRRCHLDLWESRTYEHDELLKSQKSLLGNLDMSTAHPEDGRISPNIVQLAGNDVDLIMKQVDLLMEHVDGNLSGVDLNCGCPQGIARKGKYGAFLMEEDSNRVREILSALRNHLPQEVAVSAKIRLPLDDDTLKSRIPALVETGINFLTVHGRTLYENKTKVGPCHVDRVRLAVESAHSVDPDFPVVANGGIEFFEDVEDLLARTGAVAVMSSESLLETPNIFQQSSRELSHQGLFEQQMQFSRQYVELCANTPPLPGVLGEKKSGSAAVVRSHIFRFLHRYLMEESDLIERLAAGNAIQTIAEATSLLDEIESRYAGLSEGGWDTRQSSRPESSWYRRHRKPDRRVKQKDVKLNSSLAPAEKEEMSIERRKDQIRARLAKMKAAKRNQKSAFIG